VHLLEMELYWQPNVVSHESAVHASPSSQAEVASVYTHLYVRKHKINTCRHSSDLGITQHADTSTRFSVNPFLPMTRRPVPSAGVAGVKSAGVIVVAHNICPTAHPTAAHIIFRTDVTIVAGCRVGKERAHTRSAH
jgi:hypothetical protein